MHPKLSKTLSKYRKIILVGGGTGGHVQPIVSIIKGSGQKNFLWIGGKDSQEEKAAKENSVDFVQIPTFKLSTTKSPKILLYPFALIAGILKARKLLENLRTGELENSIAVFSKGGPGSVAVGIAAWSLGIPLYIHESDTIPGRSNRILGKIATKIFLGFDSAKKYFEEEKCETLGQILNPLFSFKSTNLSTYQPSIEWKTSKTHILVICGSQGSQAIFREILFNLEKILKENELIIVLGTLNTTMRADFEKKIENLRTGELDDSLELLDWISQEDLAHLIPETDIAITRGSATTLAELTAFSTVKLRNCKTVKLIIIPLPYSADNHQYWNAKEYEKMGHTVLEQKNLNLLTQTIKELGQNFRRSVK